MPHKGGGKYTQSQANRRHAAKEDLDFVRSYGGSRLDESRAVYQAGKGRRMSRNEAFGEILRGASPSPDPRVAGSKIAHFGKHGAPNIYAEMEGGRRGKRGKRG
jgi:hypothetical protein